MEPLLPTLKALRFAFVLLLLSTLPRSGKAQWVPISPAFSSYIAQWVSPAAVNGNLLDTTNIDIRRIKDLTIYGDSSLRDISGIQYFDSLENFVVWNNLNFTPLMPRRLLTMEIYGGGNSLASPLPAGLQALKIWSNNFSVIPALPQGLSTLIVSSSQGLISFPVLPAGIMHLEISSTYNIVNGFPAIPSGVRYADFSNTKYGPINSWQITPDTFYCRYCDEITSLPSLPGSVTSLNLSGCPITTMGSVNPFMDEFNLSQTKLTSINLPRYADQVDISNNAQLGPITGVNTLDVKNYFNASGCPNSNIDSLLEKITSWNSGYGLFVAASGSNIHSFPRLHFNCRHIDLSNNPITWLNYTGISSTGCQCYPLSATTNIDLARCNIRGYDSGFFPYDSYGSGSNEISLAYNDLDSIPYPMGNRYSRIYLNNNHIRNFTPDVSGYEVNLANNQIECLNYILPGVRTLNLTNNPIQCLPNIPDTFFRSTPALDVCMFGNTYNCPALPVTGGYIFDDINQNAIEDGAEKRLPLHSAILNPLRSIHQSDSAGLYWFNCKLDSTYIVDGLMNYPYRRITTSPDTVRYTQLGTVDTTHAIGVYTIPNVNDLMVWVIPYLEARPGFRHYYDVVVKNEGTTVQNGTAEMYFDPALIYETSVPAGVVSGNKISWPVTALQPLKTFNASASFRIPVTVSLGSNIMAGAHALGNTPDTTITNNHDTIFQTAIGSYDPNDKQVFPKQGLTIQEIRSGSYLEYLVRFQNTGTASAINVRVEDTLHSLLNINSFEMLFASHNYTYTIENKVLKVYFDNIHLPDSGASEQLSHGYFRYRIRPTGTIAAGNRVPNTAYIYFDFNAPVVTNTAYTQVGNLFSREPKPQILCSGERLLLTSGVTRPVHAKQWYKNGLPTGITADTLYIDSVTVADMGQYTFRVVSGISELSSEPAGVQVYDRNAAAPVLIFNYPYTNDTFKLCVTDTTTQRSFNISQSNVPQFASYKWLINDSVVATTTNRNMTLRRSWRGGDKLVCVTAATCLPQAWYGDTIVFETAYPTDTAFVTITPNETHVCPGQYVTYTAQISQFVSSVSWYKNYFSSFATGLSVSTSLSAGEALYARGAIYGRNEGCQIITRDNSRNYNEDTARVIIDSTTIPPPANPIIALQYPPFCEGAVNRVSLVSVNPSYFGSYQWYVNGTAYSSSGSFPATYLHTGDSVQYSIIRNLCKSDTTYSNIVVLEPDSSLKPVIIIDSARYAGCSSANYHLNIKTVQNVPTNGNTYSWYVNGIVENQSGSFGPTRREDMADTVFLEINTHSKCYDSIWRSNVIVLPPALKTLRPAAVISARDGLPVCAAFNNVFFVGSLISPAGYKWYKNGLQVDSNSYSTRVRDTTNYLLMLIRPSDGCYYADTTTLAVDVSNNITPSLKIVQAPLAPCAGQQIVFDIENVIGVYGYIGWFKNDMYYGTRIFDSLAEGDKITVSYQAACPNDNMTYNDSIIVHLATQTLQPELAPQYAVLCDGNTANSFEVKGYYLGSYPAYQWYKNSNTIGTNNYQYADNNLQPGDEIYCRVNSNNPCIANNQLNTDTFTATTAQPVTPAVAITLNNDTVCEGTAVSFSAAAVNQGANPVYSWYVNSSIAATGNAYNTATLQNGDSIYCVLGSSLYCVTNATAVSNILSVIVKPIPPQPTITPADTALCPGSSVTLQGPAGFIKYEWINGATTQTVMANTADVYALRVQNNAGCYSSYSAASIVTLYPQPVVPVVTAVGNILSSNAANNVWLKSGTPINGATQSNYTVTETGWYSVMTTDNNGCTAISDSVLTTVTGLIDEGADGGLLVYPNPATGQVNIYTGTDLENAMLELRDVTGKMVLSRQMQGSRQTISTTTLARGVYVLTLIHQTGYKQVKLVLQ